MADDELVHVRVLPADPSLVFACMTQAEHLATFWGPVGTTVWPQDVVVELRAGGRFETLIVNDRDGSTHHMRARFDRVEPPGLLAWTEPASGMSVTATFTPTGDGATEVRIVQRHVPEPARTEQSRRGFASSLDRLEDHLLTLSRKDIR